MIAKCLLLVPLLLCVALQSQAQPQFSTPRPGYQNPFATRLQNVIGGYAAPRNERLCQTDSGLTGACLSSLQCRLRSGRAAGGCPGILKVCCLEVRTCNQDVVRNNTYFMNPASTAEQQTGGLSCPLRVHKLAGVCQLRLDFAQFSLRGPDTKTGVCDTDRMVIDGKDTNSVLPPICGENEGQHAYVDVGSVRGPVNILLFTSNKQADAALFRRWNIKISQIPCNSPMRAPQGCLQYFTGSSANQRIRSWNYGNARDKEMTYPAGANYAVCFRKELGQCSVWFESQGKFGLAAEETGGAVTGDQCDKDYLLIGEKKYCGGTGLPVTPTTDIPRTMGNGPLMLTVVTDGTIERENELVKFPGFDVRYKQEICNTIF